MVRIAPLILFLALPLIAHGQLYKWVDKDGKVQYSDKPPPADVKQQKKIDIKTAPAAPVATPAADKRGGEKKDEKAAAPKTIAEQDAEFRKRRQKQEEEETKQAEEAKERQKKCADAQGQLRGLQEVGRVFTYDAKGERVYADDAGRQKMIQGAQQEVGKWCK